MSGSSREGPHPPARHTYPSEHGVGGLPTSRIPAKKRSLEEKDTKEWPAHLREAFICPMVKSGVKAGEGVPWDLMTWKKQSHRRQGASGAEAN